MKIPNIKYVEVTTERPTHVRIHADVKPYGGRVFPIINAPHVRLCIYKECEQAGTQHSHYENDVRVTIKIPASRWDADLRDYKVGEVDFLVQDNPNKKSYREISRHGA